MLLCDHCRSVGSGEDETGFPGFIALLVFVESDDTFK